MWLEALGKMPPRILTLAKINMRILNSKIPHAIKSHKPLSFILHTIIADSVTWFENLKQYVLRLLEIVAGPMAGPFR